MRESWTGLIFWREYAMAQAVFSVESRLPPCATLLTAPVEFTDDWSHALSGSVDEESREFLCGHTNE